MLKIISTIKLYLFIVIIITTLAENGECQDTASLIETPTVEGKVNLSIKEGTIECDLVLKDIPRIKDYVILINTGMNIQYIRNIQDNYSYYYERNYNDNVSYEAFQYYIPDNTGKGKYIPGAIRANYVGKFPVIADTLRASNTGDWRGNIAFNGYSVRMDGQQSCWYPVLYDIKNDKKYYEVKYDIEINCPDCSVIYVNGSKPVQTNKFRFKSNTPVELSLYAGNYKVYDVASNYFLNPDVTQEQMEEFSKFTNSFKAFYEKKLKIKYPDTLTYIQTTPVSKDNAWLFVSYPTIFNVGRGNYGMKGFLDAKKGSWFKQFVAHELAHYYFGNYKKFNSQLGDVIGEGFAEYSSLQACKTLLSDSIYKAKINEKVSKLKDFKAIPFSKIKTADDYKDREVYVYSYAPIILTAIEKEIGVKMMWKWFNTILQTPTNFTDYTFLEKTLSTAINNDAKSNIIIKKYFESDSSVENAINKIAESDHN